MSTKNKRDLEELAQLCLRASSRLVDAGFKMNQGDSEIDEILPALRETAQRLREINKGIRHGTNNGRSKLTEKQVLDIRKRLNSGALIIDLADKYKVGPTTISDIRDRKRWTYLP